MCPAQEGQAGVTVPWLFNGLWKQEGGFSPQDIFNLVTSFTAFNSLSYILITQCREINPNPPFVLIILNLHWVCPGWPVLLWQFPSCCPFLLMRMLPTAPHRAGSLCTSCCFFPWMFAGLVVFPAVFYRSLWMLCAQHSSCRMLLLQAMKHQQDQKWGKELETELRGWPCCPSCFPGTACCPTSLGALLSPSNLPHIHPEQGLLWAGCSSTYSCVYWSLLWFLASLL